jgi:hypothetical protein
MQEQDVIESRNEMEKFLREGEIGYLGLSGDGKPYVVPLRARAKITAHFKRRGLSDIFAENTCFKRFRLKVPFAGYTPYGYSS